MRTNLAAIRSVLRTSASDVVLTRFATDASLWIDRTLPVADMTAIALEAIERYLACALAACRDPQITDATLDDVREKAQRDPVVSEYLKAAIAMDPTGLVEQAFVRRAGSYRASYAVGPTF